MRMDQARVKTEVEEPPIPCVALCVNNPPTVANGFGLRIPTANGIDTAHPELVN